MMTAVFLKTRLEVKCSAVKGVKSGCTVKSFYGW